jgi:hypothetical protein
MPLGAKLTQNDFKCNFWNGFWHEIEIKTYSNQLKRLKQFLRTKNEFGYRKWLKYPFSWIFANNIEIKCRERCNWSEIISNDLKCKKNILNDLKCKKRRIELVFLGPKLGYNIIPIIFVLHHAKRRGGHLGGLGPHSFIVPSCHIFNELCYWTTHRIIIESALFKPVT